MGFGDFFEKLGSGAMSTLATVAPMAASAFGGPLAGVAAQKVIGALGLSPDTTKTELEAAIVAATPDQLLAIKKAEQEFIADMKRLDIDVIKIQAADRASARDREVKTGDSWTPRVIAGIIIGLYCYVQWFLLSGIVDHSMEAFVLRSLGTLDAAVGMILGYYFGSSVGSAQKNEILAKKESK